MRILGEDHPETILAMNNLPNHLKIKDLADEYNTIL